LCQDRAIEKEFNDDYGFNYELYKVRDYKNVAASERLKDGVDHEQTK
jgi:hypothetical protein